MKLITAVYVNERHGLSRYDSFGGLGHGVFGGGK